MITIEAGQEMKLSVQSLDDVENKTKSIRYINPMAANSTEKKITDLVKALYSNSKNTYKATRASIDLGILSEV